MPESLDLDTLTVVDNPEAHRFEIELGDGVAEARYMRVGDTLIFTHTEVPEALEGNGVGGHLAAGALALVRANGLTIRSTCPFMTRYIANHPEYADLVVRSGRPSD